MLLNDKFPGLSELLREKNLKTCTDFNCSLVFWTKKIEREW